MKRRDFIKGVSICTPGLALPLIAGAGRASAYLPKMRPERTWQNPCPTTAAIPNGQATKREMNFAKWKQPVLNGTCTGGDNPSIPVDPNNFLNLLKGFAANSAYNGMRVYFAAGDQGNNNPAGLPANQVGKLTVIFVPTFTNSSYPKGGDDDPTQFWWLYGTNTPYKFPTRNPNQPQNDIATRWISSYRVNKLGGKNGLRADGRKNSGNAQFDETTSLWYNMTSIKGGIVGGQQDCGIIGRITSELASIQSMTISFGAYDSTEATSTFPSYQLLAQFDVQLPNSMTSYLGSSTGELFLEHYHLDRKKLTEDTTDTGLPCPPADSCNGGF